MSLRELAPARRGGIEILLWSLLALLLAGCGSQNKHASPVGFTDPDEHRVFYEGWLHPSTN